MASHISSDETADIAILKIDAQGLRPLPFGRYRLVWEANDNDDRGWFVVGSGEEYRFILDPQNVERGYRVVIIAVA